MSKQKRWEDLRTHPDWAPIKAHIITYPYTVEVWQEPATPNIAAINPWAIARHAHNTLRVVVADPALVNVNIDEADAVATITAAVGAATRSGTLEDAAKAATTVITHTSTPTNTPPVVAAAAIVNLTPEGTLEGLTFADVDVWAQTTKTPTWVNLTAEDRYNEKGRKFYTNYVNNLTFGDTQTMWKNHHYMQTSRDLWHRPPLGAFPHYHYGLPIYASSVKKVILASDGANLTAERCNNLHNWLGGDMQTMPPNSPHESPHGEVTVVSVSLPTSPS